MAAPKIEVQVSTAPATPPQSAGEAVLLETVAAINDGLVRAYMNGVMFGPSKSTEEEKNKFADAVLHFAAIGWAYYHYAGRQARQVQLSVPDAQIMGIIPPPVPGELPSKVQRVRAAKAAEKKKPKAKRKGKGK